MSFTYNLAQFIAFRDLAECERVRAIRKQDITKHANPDFRIHLIEDLGEFYAAFATDIVSRIRANSRGRPAVHRYFSGRPDASVRDCGPDDQRPSNSHAPRPYL